MEVISAGHKFKQSRKYYYIHIIKNKNNKSYYIYYEIFPNISELKNTYQIQNSHKQLTTIFFLYTLAHSTAKKNKKTNQTHMENIVIPIKY